MSNFIFTHPEARQIGLPPSLCEERGQNIDDVMG